MPSGQEMRRIGSIAECLMDTGALGLFGLWRNGGIQMSAFERIESGIPGLDMALDSIRLGDNVVWKVAKLEEYQFMVEPFIRQCLADGRNTIYMRFASHEPLAQAQDGLKIYHFDPEEGFETFTTKVRQVITKEGREAMYVFDSLSNLQVLWATDLMMGNFFRVTCPYLFELDTVAYFPITRGEHSHETEAQIFGTTQLMLDVYSGDGEIYMKPLKVWHRQSDTMFLPHRYNSKNRQFEPLTDGLKVSRFYQLLDQSVNMTKDQNLDSWDRFVMWAKLEYRNGRFSQRTKEFFCDNMLSKDPHMREMILEHFTPDDYFLIQSRMVGSGGIGGKACGMLLARKLVQIYLPEVYAKMEPHDSYYVGTDVFYTYIVHNGYWKQRIQQKTREGYFSMAGELKECFRNGEFPKAIHKQFERMLEYFGQRPIIVRSSSFQEDGFGNAFAGKYESVFCINTGSMEERMEALEAAVRTVYASTMDRSALEYRRTRGLEESDEQMGLLVQRVSGSLYKDFFMPNAAGVGYSYSSYRWDPQMDPKAGMLRLVVGLGTQAVDRTGSYPRIVSLDRPGKSTLTNSAQRHRFSQSKVDVLDYGTGTLHSKSIRSIQGDLPRWFQENVLEHDTDAENMYLDRGEHREVLFASCHGLVENGDFIHCMKTLLHMLQEQYDYPVDIEFTINEAEDGEYVFNLLQCRPLQIGTNQGNVKIPEIAHKDIFFDVSGSSMGGSRRERLDKIVCVGPVQYYQFPYARKPEIARAVGRLNAYFREHAPQEKIMLLVPGRIGTSSPDLGVPVAYADITQFCAICEISDSSTGYLPELSYGSHMFQDLVESGTFYTALFETEQTRIFDREFFCGYENLLPQIFPELQELSDVLRIRDMSGKNLMLYSDIMNERTVCGYYKE